MVDIVTIAVPWASLSIGLVAGGIALLSLVVGLMLHASDRPGRPPGFEFVLTALGVVLAPVWLWLLGAVIWSLWQAFARPDPAGALGLGTGALIAALLGAPFVIWTTVLKQQGLRTQREGQITDRISRAVEQLGAEKSVKRPCRKVAWTAGGETHTWFEGRTRRFAPPEGATDIIKGEWEHLDRTVPNIEVRVGALLSLERIAQDSTRHDGGRDHVRGMEIPCAHVRENAPAGAGAVSPYLYGSIDEKVAARLGAGPWIWLNNLPRPRTDVQLALSIIGRRSAEQRAIEVAHHDAKGTGYRLDLSHTDLQKADLEGLNFANAVAVGCLLDGSQCVGTDFSGANLEFVSLLAAGAERAKFANADLRGADLSFATLKAADLRHAVMLCTLFVETNVSGARVFLRFPVAKSKIEKIEHFSSRRDLMRCNSQGTCFLFRSRTQGLTRPAFAVLGLERESDATTQSSNIQPSPPPASPTPSVMPASRLPPARPARRIGPTGPCPTPARSRLTPNTAAGWRTRRPIFRRSVRANRATLGPERIAASLWRALPYPARHDPPARPCP